MKQNEMEPCCPICNKPLDRHLGLTGTCKQLQRARAVIRDMRAKELQLQIGLLKFRAGFADTAMDEMVLRQKWDEETRLLLDE